MSAPKYSKKLLDEFDILTAKVSSLSQVERIEGRLALPKFIEKHGREVCDEMFEELRRRDKKKGRS